MQPLRLNHISLVAVAALFFCFIFAVDRSAHAQRLASRMDLEALYSLRATLGLRAHDWPRKRDPCLFWTGVTCNTGRVTGLNLAGLRRTRLGRLNPRFDVDGLRNLTRLNSFNSTGFSLPGSIPVWFGSLNSLFTLDLSDCNISGVIPPTLFGLRNLAVLDLSRNSLAGSVPDSLGSLVQLGQLDLSSNSLSGPIPPALGTLRKLIRVNLSHNRLTGRVPPQLGDLSALISLEVSSNSISGPIPEDIKSLRNLQILDLSDNSLSGQVSNNLFSRLVHLETLNLSNNNFSGSIPDIWSSSQLRIIDLSDNNFYGSIPRASVANFQGSKSVNISENYLQGLAPFGIQSGNVSFDLNCFRNTSNQRSVTDCKQFYLARGIPYEGDLAPSPAPSFTNSSSSKKNGWSLKYILIGVFGGVILLVLVAFVIWWCLMRFGARNAEQRGVTEEAPAVSPSSAVVASAGGAGAVPIASPVKNLSAVGDSFLYDQLFQATSEFKDDNLIKHGHSGDLYFGVLENVAPVVVKKIDVNSTVKKDAYILELDLFAKASHMRLVPFLGHCLEKQNEKFLVYKYMPHRDLASSLFRKPGPEEEGIQSLDWIKRLKIATGVAEALCFLHHECNPPLVHRDVQASSILLDDKFEVRLGSLSEVCAQEGEGHQSVISRFLRLSQTTEQGVSGSPPASCAYDVYCFGKVLLELVTGKLGVSGSNDASTNEWLDHTLPYISIYEKELMLKILDPSLIVDEDLIEEVWAMAIVAKSCLNPKPSKRPLMKYILKALENPLKVVREESSSSARLRATSSRGSWNGQFFGSWRRSSSEISVPTREERTLKRSGTMRSHGSNGEHSFSYKRPSKEIFPEPSGARDIED